MGSWCYAMTRWVTVGLGLLPPALELEFPGLDPGIPLNKPSWQYKILSVGEANAFCGDWNLAGPAVSLPHFSELLLIQVKTVWAMGDRQGGEACLCYRGSEPEGSSPAKSSQRDGSEAEMELGPSGLRCVTEQWLDPCQNTQPLAVTSVCSKWMTYFYFNIYFIFISTWSYREKETSSIHQFTPQMTAVISEPG